MRRNNKNPLHAMALTSLVLSYLVGPLLVGIFGGRWVDEQLGTAPFFFLIGVLGGIGTGIYGLFRLLGDFLGDDDEQ
ncbi:AtpZ/AtpI family protein [Salsuginibacillus kocurii]|uniref:AtpZ/AtpI family protein n=1 Tax=Salsuginibacillus kocurii TaxID=427078 RepID=UPI00037E7832|nr:AtpZ/AtpI family protein [Salsuginibacillus kocurii]